MPIPEIINFINIQTARGVYKTAIINQLLAKGYKKDQINKAFEAIIPAQTDSIIKTNSSNKPDNSSFNVNIYLYIINAFLVAIGVFMYWDQNSRCYELDCLAIPIIVVPLCLLFFITLELLNYALYKRTRDINCRNIKDLFKYQSIILTLFFSSFLIIGVPLWYKYLYIDSPIIRQELVNKRYKEDSQLIAKLKPASDRDKKRHEDIASIFHAINAYEVKFGKYPESLNLLIDSKIWKLTIGDKLFPFPNDPLTNKSYKYAANNEKSNFLLCANYELQGGLICYDKNYDFTDNIYIPRKILEPSPKQ